MRAPPAVCFLLHFPGPCGRWALPTTLSCGARTFLPARPRKAARERPSGPLRISLYHTLARARLIVRDLSGTIGRFGGRKPARVHALNCDCGCLAFCGLCAIGWDSIYEFFRL